MSVTPCARAKREWFRGRLGLQLGNGIPSRDTLNRVFAIIHPTHFQKCFLGWVESMSDHLKLKQIPIDGKAMRGSKCKTSAGFRTVPIVSSWSSENRVTLAQVLTDEKSNESTAIPELLQLRDISGALVGSPSKTIWVMVRNRHILKHRRLFPLQPLDVISAPGA
ncbi:ISAs1 family transposase [Gemmata sp.]|uniref:ISAs1 family transposase n=1 Tax=Gemmata sp. TaxID=1914242 RepID=UPI003F715360